MSLFATLVPHHVATRRIVCRRRGRHKSEARKGRAFGSGCAHGGHPTLFFGTRDPPMGRFRAIALVSHTMPSLLGGHRRYARPTVTCCLPRFHAAEVQLGANTATHFKRQHWHAATGRQELWVGALAIRPLRLCQGRGPRQRVRTHPLRHGTMAVPGPALQCGGNPPRGHPHSCRAKTPWLRHAPRPPGKSGRQPVPNVPAPWANV